MHLKPPDFSMSRFLASGFCSQGWGTPCDRFSRRVMTIVCHGSVTGHVKFIAALANPARCCVYMIGLRKRTRTRS